MVLAARNIQWSYLHRNLSYICDIIMSKSEMLMNSGLLLDGSADKYIGNEGE